MVTRSAAVLLAVFALALAACGGGGSKRASSSSPPSPSGGTVAAEATAGLLGPATHVEDGRESVIGTGGEISPAEDRPTDAQEHGVGGAGACASASANPSASNLASIAATTTCLLNAERASKGLPPLRLNQRLGGASRLMAGLMVKQRFFAHDTPDGRGLVDRVRPTGYMHGNWSLGENIAWGSGSARNPPRDRQRLDAQPRPPGEHPAPEVQGHRDRREARRTRPRAVGRRDLRDRLGNQLLVTDTTLPMCSEPFGRVVSIANLWGEAWLLTQPSRCALSALGGLCQ